MSKYLREPFLAKFIRTFFEQVSGLGLFWDRYCSPIVSRMIMVYRTVVLWYIWLWRKMTHDSHGRFSRYRAMLSVMLTILFIFVFPIVCEFTFHAGLFVMTYKHEVVYLTNSEEIYPEEDIHSIKGCGMLPCGNENSEYYRVEATPFSEVYSLVTDGIFFYPDSVATVPGVSRCDVISYGYRLKSKFMKQFLDAYPYVLNITCMPLVKLDTP